MIVPTLRKLRRVVVSRSGEAPSRFNGSYPYTVDRKGRVVVPVMWLPLLGTGPVLCRAPEGRLFLMSRAYWDTLQARHGAHPVFQEFFTSGAVECSPCRTTRRIAVPVLLREWSGLKPFDDVIVSGLGDVIALENRAAWEQRIRAAESALTRPAWQLPRALGEAVPL